MAATPPQPDAPFPAAVPAALDSLLAQAAGATLLTASARLALWLRQQAFLRSAHAGNSCWRPPDILPWNHWLELCWRRRLLSGAESRLLLRPSQEHALWRELIESAQPPGALLLDIEATVRNALDAWRLAADWNLDFDVPDWSRSQDADTFRTWARAFDRLCHDRGWLSPALLPHLLQQHFAAPGAGSSHLHLLLAGFDELTPAQQQLVSTLRAAGATVDHVALQAAPAADAGWLPLPQPEDELRHAALWARDRLENDPTRSIAVVVPDLDRRRSAVDRIFIEVFHPESLLDPSSSTARAFNLSFGLPLAEVPLVAAALRLLDAARPREPLNPVEITQLLLSPFLAGAETERAARAGLDALLRQRQEIELPLAALAAWARAANPPCPRLATRLENLQQWSSRAGGRQPFSTWARAITELLDLAGFPGDRPLDSAEHQALQAFHDLLPELERIGQVAGPVSFTAALAHLRRLLSQQVFQPESPAAPVQVLGLLETSGLRFDHLWVLGLHDAVWPAPASPHPFLPLALQRQFGLPHSSAARESAFASQRLQGLLGAAAQVVFSVPQRDGDAELHPSPLLAALPRLDPAALLHPAPRLAQLQLGSVALELLEDHVAPPVVAGELSHGGSGIFSSQAACPFQAFATHRLFAAPLETPAPGLNARQRGQLLHTAMEILWTALGDHAALCALADPALEQHLHAAVHHALATHHDYIPALRRARLRELEAACLARLLLEWLELEKSRAPFRVLQQERGRQVEFAGLTLRLRADRVDELPDGSRLLIDYKTGEHRFGEWLGARPAQPQLPLYAVTSSPAPAALAFARLRAGKTAFHGLSARPGLLPGVNPLEEPPWNLQLAAWRTELDHLATEFRAGWALADPRDHAATCRTCHLAALCRIHEAAPAAGDDAAALTSDSPAGGVE